MIVYKLDTPPGGTLTLDGRRFTYTNGALTERERRAVLAELKQCAEHPEPLQYHPTQEHRLLSGVQQRYSGTIERDTERERWRDDVVYGEGPTET